MRKLAVLGSTGSIGVTTLSIVERFPEHFQVVALAAGRNVATLAEQVRRFQPELVSLANEDDARALKDQLPHFRGTILCGSEGLLATATYPEADILMAALVGAVGLPPTLAGVRAGKTIALANKEALVIAGELMTREAKQSGVSLLPVDSEHNAIFQSLHGHPRERLKRILLTASGGPFRQRPTAELAKVSVAEALQHPTWKMGNKITIDSATLMNKGLEVIEARWLFDLTPEQVSVIVHPQSIVHSMVEYVDGSVLAQLGIPDMAVPISYILAYPDRLPLDHLPGLDLTTVARLEFFAPDFDKFPCLRLAYAALRQGGTCPAVLNAANEVTVEYFLNGQLRFPDIAALNERVLQAHAPSPAADLDSLLEADRWARSHARQLIARLQPGAAA